MINDFIKQLLGMLDIADPISKYDCFNLIDLSDVKSLFWRGLKYHKSRVGLSIIHKEEFNIVRTVVPVMM